MPNPLSPIKPLLDILSREIKVLPATGGAVEELQHPDQDEIEDIVINKDVEIVSSFAETPEPDPQNIYRSTPPLSRREKHLFRFFVDGSIRTYFLGTGIEGTRSFPIELAQIGSAVIKREDDGRLRVLAHKHRIILLLPKQNQGISDTLWYRIQSIEKPEWLEVVDFTLPDILADTKKDPRDKAGAKARSLMHKLEIELIKATNPFRNENAWLVLDGAVKFIEEDIWNSWKYNPYLIGVAKSFRKDPMFQFGRRTSQRKDITSILAGLPYAHRTVAFSAFDGQVAFWYVRLREQRELDYPLMGVVKVELPRPNKEPVPSELADLISSALVAERNVTPYGLDRRWHCSLYPIYVAEQVIKNRFFSREVLMGCIKWSKP
ncbi:MAG TPA: hypothetical protein ENG66_00355 [Thermococcus sp.]|nr:hypothetical protein [Thermococcus sp.]